MPRAALSEEQLADFRERAIDAATHLLAGQGYAAFTMRAVAAELGCSPMTPYRYFADKAEIYALVTARAFEHFADAQQPALPADGDVAERMILLGRIYYDFALGNPDQYRVMFELGGDSSGSPTAAANAELDRQAERAWQPLRLLTAEAIAAGLLVGNIDTVAHVFWAGMHGVAALQLAGRLGRGRAGHELVEPMMMTLFAGNAGSVPADLDS